MFLKKSLLLVCFYFLQISAFLAADYYWIGGSGNWSDPQKWALSSGGTPAGTIPTGFDNAIFDGNKQLLIEIFSVVIWFGIIPADLESEEVKIISNENTDEYSQIYEQYLNGTNFKDNMIETLIFIICNLYNVNEKDLRNEEGGISLTRIISHLQSYM